MGGAGDEAARLSNLCADLISLRRLEPALLYLAARAFRRKRAGEWVSVAELYRCAGSSDESIKPELVAAWLPAPFSDTDYVVVLFYDAETQWSLTADYNMTRLVGDTAPPLAAK